MTEIIGEASEETIKFNKQLNKIRKTQLFAGIIKSIAAEKAVLSDAAGNKLAEAFDLIRDDLDKALKESLDVGDIEPVRKLTQARVDSNEITKKEQEPKAPQKRPQ